MLTLSASAIYEAPSAPPIFDLLPNGEPARLCKVDSKKAPEAADGGKDQKEAHVGSRQGIGGVLNRRERCIDLEHVSDVLCTLCFEIVIAEAASKKQGVKGYFPPSVAADGCAQKRAHTMQCSRITI